MINATSWRARINSPAFALAELGIVAIGAAALCLVPRFGIWAITASLVPWGFRFAVGGSLFRRTQLDLLIAVFLLTAFVGGWAAYDRSSASHKLNLLIEAAILYYALSTQPRANLVWVSAVFFGIGVGMAGYFFLTHDFVSAPRKIELVNWIGRAIMWVRPNLRWSALSPNYAAGVAAIMAPFGLYLFRFTDKSPSSYPGARWIVLGLLLIFSALIMTTSRGVFMAIGAAIGVLLLWIVIRTSSVIFRLKLEGAFPILVMVLLLVIVVFLYLGPAKSAGIGYTAGLYGNGSRAELFERSSYLIADFPITGGGLASFPGLYSHYILNIPIYYLPNSHNMFLDVFIEQGWFGGVAFLILYLIGIWRAAHAISSNLNQPGNLLNWIVLASLTIAFTHGMVDDYLYQGKSTVLSLVLLAIVPNSRELQTNFVGVIRTQNRQLDKLVGFSALIVAAVIVVFYHGKIRSVWYSNLGAVEMARVELSGFPTNQWAGPDIVGRMQDAEASLLASVKADPANRTANHRLGLIALLRQDFPTAEAYLETAYDWSPKHRGIIKSLGYAYAWNGNLDMAKSLLVDIHESRNEMDTYVWYWIAQGLPELSSYALTIRDTISSVPEQP